MSGRLSRLLRSLFVPGSIRARAQDRWCHADPFPSGAYNHQLMRSRAEGDFVRHPDFLWSPTPYWTARSGLNAHFRELADRLDGAVYSDVLVVLNPEDYARTRASWLESWDKAAEEELADCWSRLVEAQGWTRAMPGRAFHLKVVPDGDPTLATTLGLEPGEFATALLPNLYLGPGPDSAPLLEVFARVEGGSFRSMGTMFTDQLAFSIGAHGLDNGRIDGLDESAVYTVHRFPGETGVSHKINAERSDRIAMETGEAHGGETIRVVDRGRGKLLVEVMLVSAKHPGAELEAPGKVAPRRSFLDLPGLPGLGLGVPSGTILPDDLDLGTHGAMSIIPDALPEPVHTLSERAFLLQRVHFRDVMSGYRMEVERSGRIAPRSLDSVAAFEVVDERVTLISKARDLSLDGRPLRLGERAHLTNPTHALKWRGGSLSYRAVRRPGDARWPYLARLESPRRSVPLFAGGEYLLGRDREACDIELPDRPTAENILWRDGKTEGPISIRGGSAERTTFRTDAICVATRAASLDLQGDTPRVVNLSGSCAIHVLREDDSLVRLKKDASLDLKPGDELLVGNQVFALVPPGEPTAPLVVAGVPQRTQIGPIAESQRHENGPGSKGRRPLVGGARGRLVATENTYAALLGISPASDRPVAPLAPAPSPLSASPVGQRAASPAAPLAATGPAPTAPPAPQVTPMSLSLDPSVSVPGPGRSVAIEVGPTRADDWSPAARTVAAEIDDDLEEPLSVLDDAFALFDVDELPTVQGDSEVLARLPVAMPAPPPPAPPARQALPPIPPARSPADVPEPRRRIPRGLQIGAAEPEGGFGTLRRRSGALPGLTAFLAPSGPRPAVSAQGD